MNVAKVHVVTDSTCDLPPEMYEQLGVTMVPLNVHFGDEVYKDVVGLPSDKCFEKLANPKILPRTSQPSPGDFAEVYRRLAADGGPILSIHLSKDLSGTYQSALLAKSMVPEADVELVDSRLASLGFGVGVIDAARMAEAGKSRAEIIAHLKALLARINVYFAVDTLEFLQRNGRIGKATAFLGGLLSVKPILMLREGIVHPVEKARGRSKALARLVEIVTEKLGAGADGGKPAARVAVLHAMCQDEAEKVLAAVREKVDVRELLVAPIGAVIGTNVGPGTVGIAFHPL